MVNEESSRVDVSIVNALQNELFEKANKLGFIVAPAIDLAATNTNRGRDNGIGAYYKYREICGLKPVYKFEDLSEEMSEENIKKLASVYE